MRSSGADRRAVVQDDGGRSRHLARGGDEVRRHARLRKQRDVLEDLLHHGEISKLDAAKLRGEINKIPKKLHFTHLINIKNEDKTTVLLFVPAFRSLHPVEVLAKAQERVIEKRRRRGSWIGPNDRPCSSSSLWRRRRRRRRRSSRRRLGVEDQKEEARNFLIERTTQWTHNCDVLLEVEAYTKKGPISVDQIDPAESSSKCSSHSTPYAPTGTRRRPPPWGARAAPLAPRPAVGRHHRGGPSTPAAAPPCARTASASGRGSPARRCRRRRRRRARRRDVEPRAAPPSAGRQRMIRARTGGPSGGGARRRRPAPAPARASFSGGVARFALSLSGWHRGGAAAAAERRRSIYGDAEVARDSEEGVVGPRRRRASASTPPQHPGNSGSSGGSARRGATRRRRANRSRRRPSSGPRSSPTSAGTWTRSGGRAARRRPLDAHGAGRGPATQGIMASMSKSRGPRGGVGSKRIESVRRSNSFDEASAPDVARLCSRSPRCRNRAHAPPNRCRALRAARGSKRGGGREESTRIRSNTGGGGMSYQRPSKTNWDCLMVVKRGQLLVRAGNDPVAVRVVGGASSAWGGAAAAAAQGGGDVGARLDEVLYLPGAAIRAQMRPTRRRRRSSSWGCGACTRSSWRCRCSMACRTTAG